MRHEPLDPKLFIENHARLVKLLPPKSVAIPNVTRDARFMGVEGGRFFLSQGGFVPGFTKFGEKFTRPASKTPPQIDLSKLPQAK